MQPNHLIVCRQDQVTVHQTLISLLNWAPVIKNLHIGSLWGKQNKLTNKQKYLMGTLWSFLCHNKACTVSHVTNVWWIQKQYYFWSNKNFTNAKKCIFSGLFSCKPGQPSETTLPFIVTVTNHNHHKNKILKSGWRSETMISALIGQCNRSICIMAMSNLTGPAILGTVIGHLHMNGFLSCLILFGMIGLCSVLLPFLRVDCRQSSFRSLSQGSQGMEKVNDWEGNFPALPQVTMYPLFPHSVAWFAHSSHYPEELLSL